MQTKLLLTFLLLISSQAHSATNLACVATSIYGGPLEESFSMDEYPEISISPGSVQMGSSAYGTSLGDIISIRTSGEKVLVKVQANNRSEEFVIAINKRTKKGNILYKASGVSEMMADIICPKA